MHKNNEIVLTYEERIQMTNPHYIADKHFLYDILQLKGVACMRTKNMVEASFSFFEAQETLNQRESPIMKISAMR